MGTKNPSKRMRASAYASSTTEVAPYFSCLGPGIRDLLPDRGWPRFREIGVSVNCLSVSNKHAPASNLFFFSLISSFAKGNEFMHQFSPPNRARETIPS